MLANPGRLARASLAKRRGSHRARFRQVGPPSPVLDRIAGGVEQHISRQTVALLMLIHHAMGR
jgi:hypothetical protein